MPYRHHVPDHRTDHRHVRRLEALYAPGRPHLMAALALPDEVWSKLGFSADDLATYRAILAIR